ncbi:MAG: endolytic transglycosylase MltG [Candidatus Puniceispirillales bacterium]
MTEAPETAEKKPARGCLRRVFGFILQLVALAVVAGWMTYDAQLNRPGQNAVPVAVIIPPGAGRVVISARLNSAGISHSPWVYRAEELRRGRSFVPKAGEFLLPAGVSLAEALDIIHNGQSIQHSLTIPEGWTSTMVAAAITADDRLEGMLTPLPAEGEVLPETYFFTRGADRNQLLARMMEAREISFATLWAERQPGLPFKTLEEAVVLASIIEKETGLASERELVASVFVNRLRKGMKLQSDPTVLYGMAMAGEGVEKLLRRHLDHNSPWNTYRHKGLPPTPICNPGEASLRAALNPAESPYFYFVADGKGGHAFAETLDEHNRNVRAWRKARTGQQ